jgi:hypothetical protein
MTVRSWDIKIARIHADRGTEFFEQEGVGAVYDERAHHAFRAACNKNNIDHTVTPVGDKVKYAELEQEHLLQTHYKNNNVQHLNIFFD